MQFTSTTVDRSHTKCDLNPCVSQGIVASHDLECPFDEDDLKYQQESDNHPTYQPPSVENDHKQEAPAKQPSYLEGVADRLFCMEQLTTALGEAKILQNLRSNLQ